MSPCSDCTGQEVLAARTTTHSDFFKITLVFSVLSNGNKNVLSTVTSLASMAELRFKKKEKKQNRNRNSSFPYNKDDR